VCFNEGGDLGLLLSVARIALLTFFLGGGGAKGLIKVIILGMEIGWGTKGANEQSIFGLTILNFLD